VLVLRWSRGGSEGTGGTYSWLRQRVSAADAVEMRRMVERKERVGGCMVMFEEGGSLG